jgi:hypothetical protein
MSMFLIKILEMLHMTTPWCKSIQSGLSIIYLIFLYILLKQSFLKYHMNNANKTKSQIVNGKSDEIDFLHFENQTKIRQFRRKLSPRIPLLHLQIAKSLFLSLSLFFFFFFFFFFEKKIIIFSFMKDQK